MNKVSYFLYGIARRFGIRKINLEVDYIYQRHVRRVERDGGELGDKEVLKKLVYNIFTSACTPINAEYGGYTINFD